MRITGRDFSLSRVSLVLFISTIGYAQSIAELKIQADKGDAKAQSALGVAYQSGKGVLKDDSEAVRWWQKAAEQGDVLAQVNLGLAYISGAGVPKNYVAAARWYGKAAEQGNA